MAYGHGRRQLYRRYIGYGRYILPADECADASLCSRSSPFMAGGRETGGGEAAMTTEWLAAAYHFPATYSCRVPMSSMNSALAMPAPGPATVRLPLIRKGVELVGVKTT